MFYKYRKLKTAATISGKQSGILEKLVRRNGKLFLMRFVVLEREGKLRGKILSCQPIEILAGESTESTSSYLPVLADLQPAPISRVLFEELVSPLSTLEFFMSQMTRAPSL
ncbi:MAG: hypothetical protein EXS51_00750 [Candidatus Taylorbacteria bacterium]|nr:hypothetical protein [Candidatus Taylorbacteria bacterium]